MESTIGAILSFLERAIGFFGKHTWAFIAGLIGVRLTQKSKKVG